MFFVISVSCVITMIYRRHTVLQRFFSAEQISLLKKYNLPYLKLIKSLALIPVISLICISLLDPRGSTLNSDIEISGIDIMLCFDISRSMDAQDITPSRLDYAKNLSAQLLNTLSGHRVGMVAFAAYPVRMLPLTTDADAINLFVQELSTDMISSQSTDIAKAIEESIRGFNQESLTHKAIILFTDAENLEGNFDTAMKQIKDLGIHFLVIGTGTADGAPIPIKKNGKIVSYLKDTKNTNIITRLDSKSLKSLTSLSQGKYLLASESTLDKMEYFIKNIDSNPSETKTQQFLDPIFRPFILLALIFLFLSVLVPERKFLSLFIIVLLGQLYPVYAITNERNAYSSFKKNDYSSALRYYQRSIVKNPKNLKAKFGEGSTLYRLERYDRAEKSFLSLLENIKNKGSLYYKTLFNAANTQFQLKNNEGAINFYKEILQNTKPSSGVFKNALNNLLVLRKKEKEENPSSEQNKTGEKENEKSSQNDNPKEKSNPEDKESKKSENKDTEIKSNNMENLLGIAQNSEKENFSRQQRKQPGEFLKQNKW